MNFDRSKKAVCIIPPVVPEDPRCLDSAFALANPTVCSNRGALILKPSVLMLCVGDSIQFQAYEYKNGVETLLTSDEVAFTSNDLDVFSIGVNSGSGTCLAAGSVQITATHTDGRTVSATMTVTAALTCCDAETIAVSIVVDKSRSMTLGGVVGGYPARFGFAKAAAKAFVDGMGNGTSAAITASLSTLAEDPVQVVAQTTNKTTLRTAIAAIAQGDKKTDLLDVFTTLTNTLLAVTATRRIVVLCSDGEHTIDANRQAVIDAATLFKAGGGIVLVVGCLASGNGFDMLERIATGGYFINASNLTAQDSIAQIHYLSSLLCAGECLPEGDTYESLPALSYSAFLHFEVTQGQVNLLGPGLLDFLPGNDLYVEMAQGGNGLIRTVSPIAIIAGRTYRINVSLAGNQRNAVPARGIKIFVREIGAGVTDPNIFEQSVYPDWDDEFQSFGFSFTPLFSASVRLNFEQVGGDGNRGNLLDFVKFEDVTTQTVILLDDFSDENLTYIPPRCGQSAALPEIPNPAEGVEVVSFEGSGTTSNEGYYRGFTYVTNEGETAVTPFDDEQVYAYFTNTTISITVPQPSSSRVIGIRVWRSLSYDVNIDGPPKPLYLWGEIPVGQVTILDSERNASFLARYDNSTQAPTVNTTAVAAGERGAGLYCDIYDCASSPPGAQTPDSSALVDIESGYTPPQTFRANVEICATCDAGTESTEVNLLNKYPAQLSTSYVFGQSYLIYEFGYPVIAKSISVSTLLPMGSLTLTLEAYFNGSSTPTTVGVWFGQVWFAGETKRFATSNTSASLRYRFKFSGLQDLNTIAPILFGEGVSRACATVTETSFKSYADAKKRAGDAALVAARAQLTCIPFWEATENAEAVCLAGTFGEKFTRSATRKSYTSLADAERDARAAAQVLANAARDADCTGSNNNQPITIGNAVGRARPFPSVLFLSGYDELEEITKITIRLKRVAANVNLLRYVNAILVSPSGTAVNFFRKVVHNCAVPAELTRFAEYPFGSERVNSITFDDDAADAFPVCPPSPAGDLSENVDYIFQPTVAGASSNLPAPAPVGPYATSLSAFNGENPNGSWSLWFAVETEPSYGAVIGLGWDLVITSV